VSFPVHQDVFEGPLDLLLQLVSKERVDVAEVNIATITDDFLRAIEALGSLDLDAASSFLVLAATLLELKSLKLLPREEADPETAALLEERDRLLQRLVEYATFKGASEALGWALEANEGYFTRTGGVPDELRPALPIRPDRCTGTISTLANSGGFISFFRHHRHWRRHRGVRGGVRAGAPRGFGADRRRSARRHGRHAGVRRYARAVHRGQGSPQRIPRSGRAQPWPLGLHRYGVGTVIRRGLISPGGRKKLQPMTDGSIC